MQLSMPQADIGMAEPKSRVNFTGTQVAENVTLLTITTHHPVSCPHSSPKTDVNPEGVDMLINVLGHFQNELANTSIFDKYDFSNYTSLAEFEADFLGNEDEIWFKKGCDIKVIIILSLNIRFLVCCG